MKNYQLLLVNSSSIRREQLYKLLKSNTEYTILQAESGAQAVEILKNRSVHLVVSNIQLSDIDGWRLARMVRSGVFKCSPDCPFFIVANTWCEHIAEVTAREFGINKLLAFHEREKLIPLINEFPHLYSEEQDKLPLLAIEDNPETRDLVSRILKHKFNVELAEDGDSGLTLWQQKRHPLVLLDIMLPNMSGSEVLEKILEIDPSQTVVVMTAHSSMELAEKLMFAGAADFVAKPFRSEQLRKVCETASRREDFMISNNQFAKKVESLEESRTNYKKIMNAHQNLLNQLGSIVIELDADNTIRFLNKAWERITGTMINSATGQTLFDFVNTKDEHRYMLKESIEALHKGVSNHFTTEFLLDRLNKEPLWVEARFDINRKDDSENYVLFGTIDDISARKLAQKELEYLALHDSLTGLFNRHFFEAELERFAAMAKLENDYHSLLYIDLDHFKVINDTLGHHQGDLLLKNIAAMLMERIRQSDILCRVGGDEFAILLSNTNRFQAQIFAESICTALSEFQSKIGDHVFQVSCSIGISEINGNAESFDEYMKEADIALYAAKQEGRNHSHIYQDSDSVSTELKASLEWTRRLHQAVANDNLTLFFQPIVKIDTGEIAYYEALVRLKLDNKIISPAEFIPALERAGDMDLLDKQVIRKAFEYLNNFKQLNKISINLSAQGFSDKRMVPYIQSLLEKTSVSASRIVFELTESASLSNLTETQDIILKLRSLGCGFSIDDFGTGFSTFNYLKQLPAESVKIDGSFIVELINSKVDQALVKAIYDVAKTLNKETIAEFVENKETLNMLSQIGITYAQGYYLGKPAPADELFY
ncbi:EAL domain-containing protein [Pleionea mediterranea]|uniref:PAS domain S-box-containing protein/diguanylate cyclase (GGDEF)-like protein n=1 Tax=Pleionea mediterranea TaxID=523701 RepID=A0A316FQ33_9GAMM|nr:EAL domain-containing protein [Pleionea mediterranea]PWK50729.1 PAS domain S-box-containing protein/diguanylate cyclase (GGDEF)-like protein [Pleionea mediterranea]